MKNGLMYLKGYKIQYDKNRIMTCPKWDFGGDTEHTNTSWRGILSELRLIPNSSYPLFVTDLDKDNNIEIVLKNNQDFEKWIKIAHLTYSLKTDK